MQAFERMRSSVARESVFFDFDKFGIKPDQVSAIADNAKLASTYSNDHLTLQGNCDERGSREYTWLWVNAAPMRSRGASYCWAFRKSGLKR
jgi:hypothetical protein